MSCCRSRRPTTSRPASPSPATRWTERFQRALGRATQVTLATEEAFLGDDVLFEHASNLIQGMALLRAKELAAQPLMLTVHDRGSRELAGGTAATSRAWSRQGGRIENIDLALLRGGDGSQPSADGMRRASPAPGAPSAPRAA